MSYRDLEEADAIQKEEALRKISAMIKRYDIAAADLQALLPDMAYPAARKNLPETRLFDPFFDLR